MKLVEISCLADFFLSYHFTYQPFLKHSDWKQKQNIKLKFVSGVSTSQPVHGCPGYLFKKTPNLIPTVSLHLKIGN